MVCLYEKFPAGRSYRNYHSGRWAVASEVPETFFKHFLTFFIGRTLFNSDLTRRRVDLITRTCNPRFSKFAFGDIDHCSLLLKVKINEKVSELIGDSASIISLILSKESNDGKEDMLSS